MSFYRKLTRTVPFQYAVVVLCAITYAAMHEIFVFQNQFAPSGLMGLITLMEKVLPFDFSVGYLYSLVNVPLLLFAFFIIKKRFAVRTLVFVLVSSLTFVVLEHFGIQTVAFAATDTGGRLLAAIAAGVFTGLIYTVLVWNDACTGGVDVIAALINHKRPETNVIWVIFALNAAVAALSFLVYDMDYVPVLLCVAYIFAFSRIGDVIFKGSRGAIKFEVVTTHPDEIAKEIFSTMRHGCTAIQALGEYSKTDRTVLYCIINRREITDFERIIRKYDNTFAYFSGVSRIFGIFNRFGKGPGEREGDSELE